MQGVDHSAWRRLRLVAGVSALATVVLIPVQVAAFAMLPTEFGEGAGAWFDLLNDRPVLALVGLDALLALDYLLLVPIVLAIASLTWKAQPAWTSLALGAFAVAVPAFLASNPALEMAALAQRHASAGPEAQAQLEAAGEALLAQSQGTAFHASYLLGSLAGVAISWAMLRAEAFHRVGAWAGIGGNVLGLALYIPSVGIVLSALSGIVLIAWYAYVGWDLLRASRLTSHRGASAPP